jgi:hypothetical protein
MHSLVQAIANATGGDIWADVSCTAIAQGASVAYAASQYIKVYAGAVLDACKFGLSVDADGIFRPPQTVTAMAEAWAEVRWRLLVACCDTEMVMIVFQHVGRVSCTLNSMVICAGLRGCVRIMPCQWEQCKCCGLLLLRCIRRGFCTSCYRRLGRSLG